MLAMGDDDDGDVAHSSIQCGVSEEMKDSMKLYEYKLNLNLMKLASSQEYYCLCGIETKLLYRL